MWCPMCIEPALRTTLRCGTTANGGWRVLDVPVLDMGRPARDRLASSRCWTAIARFRRSLYLRGENGEIVCLCNASIDPGPLNVRCALPRMIDWRDLDAGPAETVEIEDESLRFGRRVRFCFGRARVWKPARAGGLCKATPARVDAVIEAAAERAPNAGLGAAFRLQRSSSPHRRSPNSDGLLAAAKPALAALARWLGDACAARESRTLPPPQALGLVGLGPGLTPSGDDYLGGLMIGLRAVNRHDLATAIARLVLPVARRQTGAISHAHLVCAAEGQAGAALHRTVAAMAGTGPFDVGPCLDAVARMGATSGWDALAGTLLPFRIRLGIRLPAPQSGG